MFSKKSGLRTKPKHTTDQDIHQIINKDIHPIINQKQKIFGEIQGMEIKMFQYINKIKKLNEQILSDSVNNAQEQQSLKGKFSKELNEIEDRFRFIPGTFGKPYEVNTNPPPNSGGKSRRRRAKSSKRTKRSKARKSGKKSSKRSTRKTRRNKRKH